MSSFTGNISWFALTVRPNHERAAERGLKCQGFEVFLPRHRVRRRWSDRIKDMEALLFPGYVFCRFDSRDRGRVASAPGVRSVVSSGREPLPVDDDEILAIRTVVASGRPIIPWPYLRVGQRVVIGDGPFAALRGVVVRVNGAWRVVVSVDNICCSIAVEVDSDAIVPERAS